MSPPFVRQLGQQPGVQLNPVRDLTGNGVLGVFDQTAAIVGRFTRGRIDRPFRVNRGTINALLGKPLSIGVSALNEARVQAHEALQCGARELVVQRLSVAAAVNSWVVFTSAASSTFTVAATPPGTAHTLSVRHLACHTDGIIVKVHADTKTVSGSAVAADMVTVKVFDAAGVELLSVKGSLTAGSVDEFGQSNYLPDVSAIYTDLLEWEIPASQTIGTTHDGYGKDANGKDKWAASTVLATFSEGGTGYVATDYDRAVAALKNSDQDFGYIMGGGTRAVLLITKLAELAYDTNRQFVFDIPGEYTVAAAITFWQSLGFGTTGRDHYPQAYWAPLLALDPVNGNLVTFGTSGAQVGYRCARNAQVNAYGLAPKNRPIAGLNGNLGRVQVRQITTPSETELSDLAASKINPVIFQRYGSASIFAFADVLTCANTSLSYRKLITVAEMSSDLDERVARFGRECLFLPQEDSIGRMKDFLEKLFGDAYASKWLVDSTDGKTPPYAYTVQRSAVAGSDTILVDYWLHYDGVTRQVFVQQSIV